MTTKYFVYDKKEGDGFALVGKSSFVDWLNKNVDKRYSFTTTEHKLAKVFFAGERENKNGLWY